MTRGEAVAENRKQPSDRGRSGGRNNRHRYGPAWHLPRASPSHSGPGSSNRDGLRKRAETKGASMRRFLFFNKEIVMRSSRLNIAAIAAMAGIASAGGASAAQGMASGWPMPVILEIGKTTGSPNRRAPGAHRAAHRAAMKLRRVKKHKARCK